MASAKRKFTVFLIILTIALGVVGYFHYQKNLYSKEVLKLEILGPEEADLAQEVEYIVKYKNNGNARLEDPQLIFEYSEHSLVVEEKPQSLGAEESRYGARKILGKEEVNFGYDANEDVYREDMLKAGIIDPLKVTRTALENAVSVSAMLLTTEAVVADLPEKKDEHLHGGGMAGMGGMM